MTGDRRKYPRRLELLRARVKTAAGEQRLYTTDVCPTGAFLASRDCPEVGGNVEVYIRPVGIKLPPMRLEAEVIRRVPAGTAAQPGYAVRWVAAHSEVGGDALYQFLHQVLKVPGITRESIGNGRSIRFVFPSVGEPFETAASLPRTGPPLQRRAQARPERDGTRVTGRTNPSRVVSDAIGGRKRRPTVPPGRPADSSVSPGRRRIGSGDTAPDDLRSKEQAPVSAPVVPDAREWKPAGGEGRARFARPVSRRSRRVEPEREGAGLDPARRVDPIRPPARSATARRNSGMSRSDNVMVGAPIRRHSGSHVSRRFADTAPSNQGRSTGRFTGVPREGSTRADDLLPQRGLNSRGPGGASRRTSRPRSSGRHGATTDSPFAERSQLFGRAGRDSTVGGRPLTEVGGGPEQDEGGSVRVDVPVSYELDSRFHGAVMVAAAPLAVEITTVDNPPQLDQQLIVNVPVEREDGFQTVYLQGKLMRAPERREKDVLFLLHIERVLEGKHEGAWTDFLSQARRAV